MYQFPIDILVQDFLAMKQLLYDGGCGDCGEGFLQQPLQFRKPKASEKGAACGTSKSVASLWARSSAAQAAPKGFVQGSQVGGPRIQHVGLKLFKNRDELQSRKGFAVR